MFKKLKNFIVEHPWEIVAGCCGIACVALTVALKDQMATGVKLNKFLDTALRDNEVFEDRLNAVTVAIENGGKVILQDGMFVGKMKDGSLL